MAKQLKILNTTIVHVDKLEEVINYKAQIFKLNTILNITLSE